MGLAACHCSASGRAPAALHLSPGCSCAPSALKGRLGWGGRPGGPEGAQRVTLRFGEEAGSFQAAAALRRALQAHLQPHRRSD